MGSFCLLLVIGSLYYCKLPILLHLYLCIQHIDRIFNNYVMKLYFCGENMLETNFYIQPNIVSILKTSVKIVNSQILKYCEDSSKNFTRKRKLPADVLINFILCMEGNSLNSEIYNNFPERSQRMTASAFVQQRDKRKRLPTNSNQMSLKNCFISSMPP